MPEPLESIKRRKLVNEDVNFRVYGNNFLFRLQQQHPDRKFRGKFRKEGDPRYFMEYCVREGIISPSLLVRLEGFERNKESYIAYIYDSTLRQSIERIVQEMERESGMHFNTQYVI